MGYNILPILYTTQPFVRVTVKWLGAGAITPLAVDGKGTKAHLLEAVARWVAARGRNVTQPGKSVNVLQSWHIFIYLPISDDCVV